MGDANHPDAWSAIPYHLLHEGRRQGVLDEGLALRPELRGHRVRRVLWNLGRAAAMDRTGGYQYTRRFLERLWTPVRNTVAGARVLSHFQLFPPSVAGDRSVEKWFYLDGTLTQLAEYYHSPVGGRGITKDAVTREREGYHAAAGVVTMSRFTADSVVRDYGVPRERVHVVIPGANLTHEEYEYWERTELGEGPDHPGQRDPETGRLRPVSGAGGAAEDPPLRIAFVGKDWRRKGLDRMLRALAIARGRGLRATLRVIGCAREWLPEELRDVPGVEWIGFVSRRTQAERFFGLLSECDVGCLLSTAELAGIALREYLAFGMVVLGPDTGGSPDMMDPQASVAFTPAAGDEEIAAALLRLEQDRPAYERLKAAAWCARRSALWEPAVARLGGIWDGRA